jgi:hypothetical protein
MISNIFLSGFFSLDNPILYLVLLVVLIIFLTVRIVIYANRILKEEGIEITHLIFENSFGGILKWSATHQTRVAILFFIILLLGIIWALSAGA